MDVSILCILGTVLVIIMIVSIWVARFNTLVRIRTRCNESWSNVQTELNRRYDLIPNLVETVKGYMKHERDLLTQITSMREECMRVRGSPAQQAVPESKLQSLIDKLVVRLENYPDLKASNNFLQLQTELSNTEDRIQAALRFYNANVREMNIQTQQFPSRVVARLHGFHTLEFFNIKDPVVAEQVQRPVPVNFND